MTSGYGRDFRLHLFRHAEFSCAGLNLRWHYVLLGDARHSLRAAGSADCGVLHAPPALQRLFDWLSPRLDYVRRACPSYCHCTTGLDQIRHAIACYIAACAIVSIIATLLMPDDTDRDISQERA